MKFKVKLLLAIFLAISGSSYADDLVNKANHLLSTTPEEAVNQALENNDFHFLHTPVCAEGMPGFDFAGYKGEQPNPKEIWSTCEGLMGRERYQLLLKMEKWVTQYNELMAKHRK
jgi:hypothetical protein